MRDLCVRDQDNPISMQELKQQVIVAHKTEKTNQTMKFVIEEIDNSNVNKEFRVQHLDTINRIQNCRKYNFITDDMLDKIDEFLHLIASRCRNPAIIKNADYITCFANVLHALGIANQSVDYSIMPQPSSSKKNADEKSAPE